MKRPTPITAIAVSTAKPIAKPILSRLASDGLEAASRVVNMLARLWGTRLQAAATAPAGRRTGSTAPASKPGSPSTCRQRQPPLALRADRRRPLQPHLPASPTPAGRRWALRRPPLGKRLGSAHDMGREHKVVSALGPTEVPVPPVVGLCEDESVNGAPLLRDGVRRGADPARPGRGRGLPRRRRPARDRRCASPTPWPRSTPSTPTRSGSATSAARRTTSPASCAAGRASGRSRRRASWRRSTASTSASPPASPSRARRRSSTATTASTT